MQTFALLALAGLTSLVQSTPVAPAQPRSLPQAQPHIHTRQADNSSSPACAQVSQALYGSGTTVISQLVPAGMAWDCINSVPLNATSAKLLIESLKPYIVMQSTLTVLKDPPAEYVEKVQPAVDIMGGLDKIVSDVDSGKFANEYAFGWALYTLIQSAHDGHFTYVPESVGGIFTWGRNVPLVSVSEDGEQLPAVFAFEDVLGLQYKNISYTPSAVVKIDGMETAEFLENLSQFGSLQDRDALYNNVFYELAQVGLGESGSGTGMFTGGGRGRYVFPGATTAFTFANGTERTIANFARVRYNFRRINTGEDLAKEWFNYGSAVSAQVASQEPEAVSTTASGATGPGYPDPATIGPLNLINGFYIDAPGYEDVAVLSVPNFVGTSVAQVAFQKTSQEFIPKALADGKTKLILDLQANGGGTILQGYDLFKQLFPDLDPYGANRYRATEAADLIGQSYSKRASLAPRGSNSSLMSAQSSYFDYHQDMTVDGEPFTSWAEKFGPNEVNGDQYTTLSRWNLSDVYTSASSGGINITGYGPLANITGPPRFKPENIVIVTDGYCASTCTIFTEFLTKQAGVKTIAMGGRSNKDAIQAIGGVKGVNNYQFGYIQQAALSAIRWNPAVNDSILVEYQNDLPFYRAAGGVSPGVNVRDGLPLNDTAGIALQFVYEEADCRLFYTPEMTVDMTAIWTAAADARWGQGGKCVAGGNYGQKRSSFEATTELKPRRVHVSQAVAVKKVQTFENTFGLKTNCHMKGDGFMHP
ncbi:peptidase S41 family protein-like protein [Boeremia exigua]|uniref:peptidase S41 family protein-like protein n=1 Tax=Boeremia exigua TaxID=749465 RepID=UPI001E8E9165|nr:peptidase S41 family protein-like protein [Boeremia exigua]KAH6642236.1 peptidase S41 family protein-like protein [Boeremia exigua]